MEIQESNEILDGILADWRSVIGPDFPAYRNHCYRVFNFCLALNDQGSEAMAKIAIAAGYHDLGIWAEDTFDYIDPSVGLARDHLKANGLESWSGEIEAMIAFHHKLTAYKERPREHPRECPAELVEAFRRADWIDVSMGHLRFGLPWKAIAPILSAFPNAGFHRRLAALAKRRFSQKPFSPLPMLRF
jgi:hypothetical protein